MKKINLVLIMALLLVFPLVSAAEFDNVGSYDEETKTMTVTNWLGLGDEIAKITLKSPLDLRVARGEEVLVAWYDLENLQQYNGLEVFDVIETLDLKRGNSIIQKNIVFKKKQTDLVSFPIYETSCFLTGTFSLNGTEIQECSQVQIGTEEKEVIEWKIFNTNDLLEIGNYTIGLFTEVEKGDKIEWIPTMYGIEIVEWAVWTADLNTNLVSYWKMDENGLDALGINNATVTGVTSDTTTKKLGTGSYYYDGGADTFDLNTPLTASAGTLSFWIRTGVTTNSAYVYDDVGAGYFQMFENEGGDGKFKIYFNDGGPNSIQEASAHSDSTWYNIVLTWDSTNVQLWKNGASQGTVSAGALGGVAQDLMFGGITPYMVGNIDEIGLWSRKLTDGEVADLYNGGTGITYTNSFGAINATLVSPADNFNVTYKDIAFNWTVDTPETTVENSTLYINGVVNQTFIHGTSNHTDEQVNLSFADGNYNWTVLAYDDVVNEATTDTRYFGVDTTNPVVSIIYPTGNIADDIVTSSGKTIYLNWSSVDTNLGTCWYYNNTANVTVTCGVNATFTLPYGTYTHIVYANDTYGNENSDSQTSTYSYALLQNALGHNSTAYETSLGNFNVNVTKGSAYTDITSGFLWFNGTKYTATETDNTGSSTFNYNLQLPNLTTLNTPENKSVKWEFILDTTTYKNLSVGSQILNPINVTHCFGNGFLNVTFKDEKDLTVINATMENNWKYYLGDGVNYRTNTYQNTTYNWEYNYCFQPSTSNVTITGTSTHENPSYPQRKYNYAGSYISSSIINTIVYLLGTSDGIYTTFQVLTPSGATISGVTATVTTTVGGSSVQTDAGTTGDDGGVTFWVNPDKTHTFAFSKTGYPDTSVSLTPTQSQYTVYMGGQALNTTLTDYGQGISFSVTPAGTELTNNTIYSFNYTLASSYFTVTDFGYILRNKTDTLGTTSALTNGGTLNTSVSTGTSDYIIMDYYWNVNGNYTNVTKTWIVVQESKNLGIKKFFTHLTKYTNEGIFGLNEWSRTLLIFLFIFIVIGMVSSYTGNYNPAPISLMLFGLVVLFDGVLGMIPTPPNAVDNFASIVALGGVIIAFIWEGMNR